jgi:hypothetical protein
MTSLHPTRHRLHRIGFALTEEHLTLHTAGWRTAGVSHNPSVRTAFGSAQGFELFEGHEGKFTTYPDVSKMLARVSEWIADGPPQPFFLYLRPMNAHGPY